MESAEPVRPQLQHLGDGQAAPFPRTERMYLRSCTARAYKLRRVLRTCHRQESSHLNS